MVWLALDILLVLVLILSIRPWIFWFEFAMLGYFRLLFWFMLVLITCLDLLSILLSVMF